MEIRFFQTHDSPLQSLTGISEERILWDFSTQWINTEGLKQKDKNHSPSEKNQTRYGRDTSRLPIIAIPY